MRSLIMSDVETNTEWSHLLGRGMKGKHKAKTLEPIVSDMLTWSAWREQFPDTTVLAMSRTAEVFTKDVFEDPQKYVVGFHVKGLPYMVPMKLFATQSILSVTLKEQPLLIAMDEEGSVVRLFDASVDHRELTFFNDDKEQLRDQETKSTWDRRTGEAIQGELKGSKLDQLVGIMSYRKAWLNFHPTSKTVER